MQTLITKTITNEYGNKLTYSLIHMPAGVYPAGSGTRFEPHDFWKVKIERHNDIVEYGQIFKDKLDALDFFTTQTNKDTQNASH